jgi:hypothetical protein
MGQEISLTGLWEGQFSYPVSKEPEFFTANLLETLEFLGGSIQETIRHGKNAGRLFYASVQGRRFGSAVHFIKKYETPPQQHQVRYEGVVNADATEIEGSWTIPGSWSGRFLMIRGAGLVPATAQAVPAEV